MKSIAQRAEEQARAESAIDAISARPTREELSRAIEESDNIDDLVGPIHDKVISSGLKPSVIVILQKKIAMKTGTNVSALQADARAQQPDRAESKSWRNGLVRDDGNDPYPCLSNIALILENDPAWNGVVALDEFADRIWKHKPPPYAVSDTGEWTDRDDSKTTAWMTDHYGIRPPTLLVSEAVSMVAEAHKFHPVQDYLSGLEWDKTPRVTTWLSHYMGAEDKPYTRLVGRAWLIGAVARIFRPGCKMDNVLILEGKQGHRKSSAFDALAGEWFSETAVDLGSKDSFISQRGKWIIELPELDSFNRAEASRAKQFFATRIDTYRPPYGRRPISVPRSCVYAGSVNSSQYLKDDTGNRRYWPVATGMARLEEIFRDRDQLWAEAVALYLGGTPWWFEADLDYVQAEQQHRHVVDAWEELISRWAFARDEITTSEVMDDCLGIPPGKWTKVDQMRVGSVLTTLGYSRERRREGGARQYVYTKNTGRDIM